MLRFSYDYYVGIDYSITSPGICVIDDSDRQGISLATFDLYYCSPTKSRVIDEGNVHGTLVPKGLDETDYYIFLAEWAASIIPEPALVLIEDYSYNSYGQNFNIGENTGTLKRELRKLGHEVRVVDLTHVKKIATGSGSGKKPELECEFEKRFGISLQTLIGVEKFSDKDPVYDLVDAFYIAEYAYLSQECFYPGRKDWFRPDRARHGNGGSSPTG